MIPLLAALLATSGEVEAASNEVSVELGTIRVGDDNYDLYSERNAMLTLGVRGGLKLHRHFTLIGTWAHHWAGADVFIGEPESENGTTFQSALVTNHFGVGAKADFGILEIVYPYFAAQVLVVQGRSRIDDDAEDPNSAGQLSRGAVAPGFLTAIGADFQIPKGDAPFTLGLYIEGGYGWVAPLNFADIGSVKSHGFALRSGLGVRF